MQRAFVGLSLGSGGDGGSSLVLMLVGVLGLVGTVVAAVADPTHGQVGTGAVDADDLALAQQDVLAMSGAVDSEHQLILPARDLRARRAMLRMVGVRLARRP
jgi:hypothetical protein